MMQDRYTDTHRESLVAVLGAPPEMCPIEPEVLQTESFEDYKRLRVSYFVSPGERVESFVLLPLKAAAPVPAVICHHRHNDDWSIGKSEIVGLAGDSGEAIGVELVKRGYVVLAPDAIAFEDRRSAADPGYRNNFQELAVRLLRGETLLRKAIWDISRGIDYLETLSEVDADKIGIVGHGYGSLMAAWVAALDVRITVAAGYGDWTSMHEQLRRKRPIQIELAVPRLLQVADYDWVLGVIAPRPFLISTIVDDATSLDARMIYERAHAIYERLNMGDRLGFIECEADSGQSFPSAAREKIYEWLDRWLKPPAG